MFKSKNPLSLNQTESVAFGKMVSDFRNICGLSIHELAVRIGENSEYVKNVESGNISIGIIDAKKISEALNVTVNMLLHQYLDEDVMVSEYNKNLHPGNYTTDDVFDDVYIKQALDIIADCSDAECSFISKTISFVYDAYSNGISHGVTIKFQEDDQYSDVESCMSHTVNCLQWISVRDRAFMVNAIELSLKQIRAGMMFAYIPFPSLDVHKNMVLISESIDHNCSGEYSSHRA